jgi:hypothetical protein
MISHVSVELKVKDSQISSVPIIKVDVVIDQVLRLNKAWHYSTRLLRHSTHIHQENPKETNVGKRTRRRHSY